jgi:hypothetical protein
MIVNCPHCNQMIFIVKIKCGIFRCGIKKSNNKQIGSHCKKKYVDRLLSKNAIYGCGNPFKIDKKSKEVSKCGWI